MILAPNLRLITLFSKTGCGKTALLRRLALEGQQIIDLEALANHKGSAFGNLEENSLPTKKAFYDHLQRQMNSLDLDRPVFVEWKGHHLGPLKVPDSLFQSMLKSSHIVVEDTLENRINRIQEVYQLKRTKELYQILFLLKPRLEPAIFEDSLTHLDNHQLPDFIRGLLTYYDGSRHYQLGGRKVLFTVSRNRKSEKAVIQEMLKYQKFLI